jgi:beta-N-acetylhexosaminidase
LTVKRSFRLAIVAAILCSLLLNTVVSAAPLRQTQSNEEIARQLLESMQPEERVGQLFVVSFNGPEAAPGSQSGVMIYDLIVNYHIGGVVLQRVQDNFVGSDQTIPILASLTDQLQRNEFSGSRQNLTNPITGDTFTPAFIPLFIGIAQNGGGSPNDQILSGVTTLPNQIAIGATWQPELARLTGELLGRELNILGINLLFGPSLDILEPQFSGANNSVGVNTFGSDPFWVSEMSRAYITGLHQGSNNMLAVIGKHFPGIGGADRRPEEEVATIRKTLDQLRQFELYPFFATTGLAASPEATLDGMLTAHLRIQGFQENLRQTTKPISFDLQAFSNLMSLPALNTWRQNGGIMISDSLGSRAVRRYYDPTGQSFNARVVALDSFLAGNDILFLDKFISSTDPDEYTTITRTINFFAQKYREDPLFAQRVDESVLRILSLKLRLYDNNFLFSKVQPAFSSLSLLGKGKDLSFQIAKEAATLISPPFSEFDLDPPILREQIVFISDNRLYQQCSQCILETTLAVNALEQAVIRLYSPQAGGQILPRDLSSFSYQELHNMLESGIGETEIEAALRQAEWIIFLTMDVTSTYPVSLSLERFLDERPDLYQGKKMVAFALNLPYNLGATEIAKLSAFYGLYSRSNEFLEIAARLLFQEVQPVGALPISVPAIGHDINRMTFPNPNQVIPLKLENLASSETDDRATPEATPSIYTFRIGELVDVSAGVILDRNGHIVPDGTIVRFIITQGGEMGTVRQVESQTMQGVARATLRIDTTGNLEIRAESEEAKQSDIIQIIVPIENITITPPPEATITPSPTPSPTETLTPTPTPSPTSVTITTGTAHADIQDWLVSFGVTVFIAACSYVYSLVNRQTRWAVRSSLLVLIGGILAYIYIVLQLPGSIQILERNSFWSIAFIAGLGACIGWLITLTWKQLSSKQSPYQS